MTGQAYSGLKNTRYTAGREVGRGGEGAVFEVRENPALVIKIYGDILTRDKANKLTYMASIHDAELNKFAAWPLDAVTDNSRRICGFIMRRLDGFVPLHMLFSPMDRKKLFPDKGYNFLIHVARNLATAFHKIHKLGIVIGDVNEGNILVNAIGMLALIDCDSFQIKNGNVYHFCEVGIPRYTPPELLQIGTFNNVIRTFNTDSFSLAILIFQLLFLGRHPFTGRNLTAEDIDEEKAIRTHEFAYSLSRKAKKLSPAKNSFQLQNLSAGLINLFHASFETDARPSPWQWVNELEAFNKEIITCSKSKLHFYPRKLTECPWCAFKDKTGIVYFLDDSYLKEIPELKNIEQFVNGFKLDNIALKKLPETYNRGKLTAMPINPDFLQLKKINDRVIITTIALDICIGFLFGWGYIVPGLLFLLLFYLASPTRIKLKEELSVRTAKFHSIKANFEAIIRQHNTPADLNRYNMAANKLTGVINIFKNLPHEFAERKKQIEEKYYNIPYQQFLQQFEIKDHPVPTFGPAKKLLIFNHGIKTAADIGLLHTMKIQGIGPKNQQILFDWQRHVGSAFTYKPDVKAINNEINMAVGDISAKKRKLELDIKSAYRGLHLLRVNILSTADTLERQYHDMAKKLYQADIDLQAFKRLAK